MNYVGSISILDRGDAPAQAVIDRNARSLAQRIADDTKDELEKVMTRVETIYSTFEDTEQVYGTSNLEYLQDVAELEELMKDQVKKKKYQQQVTIFIVGFSDVSGQKLRLMQQVNEFFTENSKNIDEEEWFPTTPDLDLEEVGDKIEDSLQVARELTQHLGDLNKEMVEYMASYAEKKATTKGKKKVERALQQARDEVQALAEKLQSAQTDVEEKEEKLQATFKQLELKNLEVQKFRTAAELAKQKITSLTKELEEQKQVADDAKRDLSKFHDDQLTKLREVHQQDMDEMKKQHAEQIKSLSGISDTQSEVGRQFDLESSEDGTSRQSSKQESRPSTKGRGAGVKKTGAKSGGKDSKGGRNGNKEFSEAGMQDEGGDPSTALFEDNKNKPPGTRHSRRSRSTLAPVEEFEDYDEVYDLTDEQAWASVPKDQLEGRFAQYRRICQHKLRETDEQRQLTVAKTQRKVQLLKAQFVEHKTKWETERKVLISQVEQAQQLQTDAEKEADQAMTQLEDFIAEQERLEEEEEVRRSAILRGTSIASLSPGAQSPGARTPLPSTPAAAGTVSSAQGTRLESRNTQSSEELNKLMQQTDDAKAEELKGRLTGTKSAPPGVDTAAITPDNGQEQTTTDTAQSGMETDDTELAEGASQEAVQQVGLEELKDLPPIDGTSADEMSTPSIQPPPTAATIGSLPSHDQLETPLAEIANGGAAGLAKGDKEASELKEDTPEAIVKIQGDTEHDLREASARSRASLRSVYKNRLEESRAAAEDRRTKSPHIALPSSLSVDDELVLDDDDEDFDEEMALPDDLKEELEEQRKRELSRGDTGTSPPPGPGKEHYYARKSMSLVDHPLLKEYLKTYDCVTGFKDSLGKVLLDKDMMSASQIVSDLEILAFDKDKKVMPQVEMLTNNVIYILEEISSVINHAVMVDREPPVSSLFPFSRDEMRSRLPPTREASEDMYPAYSHPKMVTPATGFTGQVLFAAGSDERKEAPLPVVDGIGLDGTDAVTAAILGGPMQAARRDSAGDGGSGGVGGDVGLDMGRMEGQLPEAGSQAGSLQGSRKSSVSGSTKQHLAELQAQCSVLQCQLEDESKKHEEQLRHNTVVMMEMQDTINELQRELSAIGKATNKPRSAASSAMGLAKAPSPDQSLLFTRLDLERNAKTMKKAVMDQRLSPDKYKEAVTTMDDYVSLPAQRLAHLVKKYVHHSRMKEIEENVKNSESLDEGVFDALDKMEALQNQRARQWAEKMDSMGLERLRLAAMLMDSLDSIEQESGLFLIKPMYSYRGRELKAPPTQKLARPVRSQPVPRHQSAAVESTTSFVPAPTPASNMRRMDRQTPTHQVPVDLNALPPPPPSRPEDGVVGAGAIRNIVTPQMPQVAQSYQTWNMSASQARSPYENLQHPLNTPRMLELDINRMLIGQNNVSTKLPHPPSDDRLVNASNNSLRSYVTVQRPTATLAAERPLSASGGRDTAAPPSSPRPLVPVSPADRDLPQSMTSPPPLPPIADRSGSAASSHHDDPEPPRSPPGSSMYQSTTQDLEEGNLAKEMTRTSSQFSNLSMSDGQQE